MKFDFYRDTLHIDVDLKSKVSFFIGNSGEGKTFFFDLVKNYLLLNGVKFTAIDHNNYGDPSKLPIVVSGSEVVILDNADLYLTPELLEKIKAVSNSMLISIKNRYMYSMKDAECYVVNYDGDNLRVMML